jgi:hypothetical protein
MARASINGSSPLDTIPEVMTTALNAALPAATTSYHLIAERRSETRSRDPAALSAR